VPWRPQDGATLDRELALGTVELRVDA
jgi:hypothetical protein